MPTVKPESGVTREQLVNKLSISVHGKYSEYVPVVGAACAQDPEWVAHVIAWDYVNGQVKDSKIALPVITLATGAFPDELVENSLAHLAMQPPREILKALRFSIESGAPARRQKRLEVMVRGYLGYKEREPGKWARLAIRHRRALKSLYCLTRCPAPEWVSTALFGEIRGERAAYAPGSVFAEIAGLHRMDVTQVAAVIARWHLSPLVVSGAMAGAVAGRREDSAVVQATMNQMSDTEVVTQAASLERKGLGRDAALRETFRKKVAGASKSKKATLKTGVAAEEVEDEGLRDMLRELQERQIQAQKDAGRGIEGNWLVIADRSQSQEVAITLGTHVAAAIAKFVAGKVWLLFCNDTVTPVEATGKSLEDIQGQAKFVFAGGGTSYGVGLQWALEKGLDLDGVVIVGDGGENSPPCFADRWHEWKRKRDKELPVYLFQTFCPPEYAQTQGGNPRNFAAMMSGSAVQGPGYYAPARPAVPFTAYDLTKGAVDYYSIPNLVQGLSASRFGVVEKIMACPLVTLEQVMPGWEACVGR